MPGGVHNGGWACHFEWARPSRGGYLLARFQHAIGLGLDDGQRHAVAHGILVHGRIAQCHSDQFADSHVLRVIDYLVHAVGIVLCLEFRVGIIIPDRNTHFVGLCDSISISISDGNDISLDLSLAFDLNFAIR